MLRRLLLAASAAAALGVSPAPVLAAPPPNDTAAGAAVFSPYSAAGRPPSQQQAVAELAEATPDAGVPRCLGADSFARTAWFRLPEAPTPTEVTLDASGATLDVVDLAAFVQPPPPAAPVMREPNACDGAGAGGSAAAEEPTSAVSLLVPAGHAVLFQVGRRGTVGAPANERALLALDVSPRELPSPPRGDHAGTVTPRLRGSGANDVPIAGATLTEEDPAQPPCPSLGTVWRRIIPGSTGRRLISVTGIDVSTFAMFAGSRPTGDNVLDCVNRERPGPLQMVVPVRRKRPLWVRLGTERTVGGESAAVEVRPGRKATVIDGGAGGFDPTPYGPAGGFPSACRRSDPAAADIVGPALRGRAGAFNRFTRVPVRIRVSDSSVCDAQLRLYGPGGRLYARARAVRLAPGGHVVRLPRLRTFRRGGYRLEVNGVDRLGRRVRVPTDVGGRLRRK